MEHPTQRNADTKNVAVQQTKSTYLQETRKFGSGLSLQRSQLTGQSKQSKKTTYSMKKKESIEQTPATQKPLNRVPTPNTFGPN
jgi:hypothetical protein